MLFRSRDDSIDTAATKKAVAQRLREKTAKEWRAIFAGKDLCSCVVASMEEALEDPHFKARGVFSRTLTANGKTIIALPVPVVNQFRGDNINAPYPALGEANDMLKTQ